MLLIRLVLLLAIAAGLSLFALSNLQPLSLTFLGIQTPALPLALWVLGAIAAGILTSLLISALFGLSNYLAAREARSQVRQAARRTGFQSRSTSSSGSSTSSSESSNDDSTWSDWEGYEEPVDRKPSVDQSTTDTIDDDWESELDDDWEGYEPTDTPRTQSTRNRDASAGEQEPKSSARSSSVYSYGYRQPGGTGVGKTEPVVEKPVVDAEYRVIVPPYRSPDSYSAPESYTPSYKDSSYEEPEESADDWFEEDDDEFEDDRDRRNR